MISLVRASVLFALAVVLVACGGGGGDSPAAATPAPAPAPVSSAATAVAVNTYCGYAVGASMLSGTVTAVTDGDTVKVATSSGVRDIRLDGIDAPEMAQPYGPESRANLSALVVNQPVTVTFSKSDQYGRVVGSVFTSSCQLANLNQLQTGSAWFYKAYQCELSASVRTLFAEAQTAAAAAPRGLWAAAEPTAPWVFRNGSEPATPTCPAEVPFIGQTAQSEPVASIPLAAPSTTTTGLALTIISSTPSTSGTSSTASRTCYVGPRGGTYTLTSSGEKNYSGC
jgi:endonuclease YncB( thermonuclease family)